MDKANYLESNKKDVGGDTVAVSLVPQEGCGGSGGDGGSSDGGCETACTSRS
jgi:hypothetical protein